jgi:hypothetical protein
MMNPGIHSAVPHRTLMVRGAHTLVSLAMGLAMGVAWLPAAMADDLPAPPHTIIVDRLSAPMDSGSGVEFHPGQMVQYRVRAYDVNGNPTQCNPAPGAANNQPQVMTHNPATGQVAYPAHGEYTNGTSYVDVTMGPSSGAAFLEVSCGSAVKKVLLSNDGEAVPQNQKNPPNNQDLSIPPPAAQNGLAGAAPANGQQPAPAPEDDSASGSSALLIAGLVAVAVVGVVAIAAAAGGSSSSSGSTCNSGSHQCSPPNASICCPDGTTIYCTNSNTCTNLTSANFGNVCGNQAAADGC